MSRLGIICVLLALFSFKNIKSQSASNTFDTFVVGDPHVLAYKRTESETCNIIDEICLSNSKMEIRCYGTTILPSSKVTVLSALKIKFIVDDKDYEYVANNSLIPDKFMNGDSIIKDSANNVVVKVYSVHNGVYLYDLARSTSVFISNYGTNMYYLLVRGDDSFYASSTGILVNGCPNNLINTNNIVKKGIQSDYDEACKDAAYYNNMYNSEIYKMCVFDYQITHDMSYIEMYKQFSFSLESLNIFDVEVKLGVGTGPGTTNNSVPIVSNNFKSIISSTFVSFILIYHN